MVIVQSYFLSYNYQQDKSTYYDCSITLQTAVKIAASNVYCKITLVWLDSSLSVVSHIYSRLVVCLSLLCLHQHISITVIIISFIMTTFNVIWDFSLSVRGTAKSISGGCGGRWTLGGAELRGISHLWHLAYGRTPDELWISESCCDVSL